MSGGGLGDLTPQSIQDVADSNLEAGMAELEKEYFDDVQKGFDLLKERTGSNWSEECRITIEDLAPWPALCTLMYQVKANRSQ